MADTNDRLDDSNENCKNSSDKVVLILNNYNEIYSEMMIDPKVSELSFSRIFRIESKTIDKHRIIEKIKQNFEKFIQGYSGTQIPVKECFNLIFENIQVLLKEYLKLDIEIVYSIDKKKIYISIEASEKVLMMHADLTEYHLQMVKDPVHNLDFQQVPPYAPFEKEEYFQSHGEFSTFLNFFQKYDDSNQKSSEGSIFLSKDRVKIISIMINHVLDLELLKTYDILHRVMLLHNPKILKSLKKNWGNLSFLYTSPFKKANLDEIRNYFGEKIAFYYAWLEYSIILTIPLAVISLSLGIVNIFSNDITDDTKTLTSSEIISFAFAILLPFFAIIYEQVWIRKQKLYSWKWGTLDLKSVQVQRLEFIGKFEQDPVSGIIKKVRHHHENHMLRRYFGFFITLLFILIVIGFTVGLFAYRSTLDSRSFGDAVVGVVNGIEIKIMKYIYKIIARKLNDYENYEFPKDYDKNLTIKLFIFQFVNSYTSLFYIAYLKGDIEGCDNDHCIDELSLQLGSIFLTHFLIGLGEILAPIALKKYKKNILKKQARAAEQEGLLSGAGMSEEEKQDNMEIFKRPLEDYMEIIINYGYVIMFQASFPFASALYLILIILEIRVDAWKLCFQTQRPKPYAANSIGVWMLIIEIISFLGIMTNMAIIIFTTDVFDIDNTGRKWRVYIIVEHALIFLKVFIAKSIPNTPSVVKKAQIWGPKYVDRKLYGKPDYFEKIEKLNTG